MVGVLTAWTLFITIPERLASAFKDLAAASMRSADQLQQNILQVAGLMVSFADFGGTVDEQFSKAIVVSRQLTLVLS